MIAQFEMERLKTLEQVREFSESAPAAGPERMERASAYELVTRTRARFSYWKAGRKEKGLRRRYMAQATGLSVSQVTRLLGRLSGPATRKLLERAFGVFGDVRYERLAGISNGHLYNLRRTAGYRRRALQVRPTTRGSPAGGWASCGWTRCTRATAARARGCTSSTGWTR